MLSTQFDSLRATYSYLSDEQWMRYAGMFQRIEVPTKTILLREGDVAKKAFYIEQGCLRVWFNNKGRDTTFQLFFEGQGLSSIESFRKNIPSFFTIEAIEPCILYAISKKDLNTIFKELDQYKQYHEKFIDFAFGRQLHYMREFLSFVKDTPAERYANLLKDHPHIVQRVPQQYIASYLGITSVSLSRIKGRLMKATGAIQKKKQ